MKSWTLLFLLWCLPAHSASNAYTTILSKCQKGGIGKNDLLYFLQNNKQVVNEGDNFNTTLLMWCVANGRGDTVNTLLENGAFVNAQSNGGETALHIAAKFGQKEIVWRLLKANANKNLKDKNGNTPADNANKAQYYEIVELLGGKPQNLFNDEKRKAAYKILEQAFKGEISVAEFERLFPPYGPLIDEPFNNGSTILQSAAYYNNNELLAAALRLKANPDLPKESGTTPLMFAASAKNYDGFRLLIEAGALPDLKNNEGKKAMDFAEDNAKPLLSDFIGKEMFKDLRNRKLIVNYLKGLTKNPSKFKAKIKAHEDEIAQMNKDIIAAEKKAIVPQAKPIMNPPPIKPSIPISKMIADAFVAIERGDVKYFIKLLDQGLPPDARDGNGNPLILQLCIVGNPIMLKALVSRGANINIKGVNGLTPLMVSTVNYKYDVVAWLVQIGAEKRIKNNFNWTAFDFARQNRDERLMFMTRF